MNKPRAHISHSHRHGDGLEEFKWVVTCHSREGRGGKTSMCGFGPTIEDAYWHCMLGMGHMAVQRPEEYVNAYL